MGDGKIEKRACRIERWLKRCVAACKSGSWSSALMEAECLEAEARGLREDMWKAADASVRGEAPVSTMSRIALALRVAAVTFVMIAAFDLPLSTDQDRPFEMHGEVALLTSSEADILNALRSSLSSGNRGDRVVVLQVPAQEERPTPRIRQTRPAAASERIAAPEKKAVEAPEKEIKAAQEEREISVEDVLALVQVGERALHISNAGVRVLPDRASIDRR